MEFLRRLKSLIPTVHASETNGDERSIVSKNESGTQGEVTPDFAPKITSVDLSESPENYSDILVDHDYEYFPEREQSRYKPSLFRTVFLFEGREEFTRTNCELKLHDITKEEPLIKLLLGALKASGCPTDIRRNFSCEMCYHGVCGGYDAETQQVVMCMNNVKDKGLMTTILAHELIHMFDHCVNKTDFKKPEHLACTEIRAINLTSCSLLDAFFSGHISTMDLITKNYGQKHAVCVKERALKSVMAATSNLSEDDARTIIDKVFPYCYNDLEPVGRRLRHKTTDGDRAYHDGQHYGYV